MQQDASRAENNRLPFTSKRDFRQEPCLMVKNEGLSDLCRKGWNPLDCLDFQ
jgi:hypothetical protein